MSPHPLSSQIKKRLATFAKEFSRLHYGIVFRMADPKWTKPKDIISGKGATESHGRWHTKGDTAVCHTSVLPETALAEIFSSPRRYGYPINKQLPKVLVAIQVKLNRIIDLNDGALRQHLRISRETLLKTDWRLENNRKKEAITQAAGKAIYEVGLEGFIVSSSTSAGGYNLIIFPQNLHKKSFIKLDKNVKWPN